MIPIHSTLLEMSDVLPRARADFGKRLSRSIGMKNFVFTYDGRNALNIALESAGLRKSDEVIVPGYTCSVVPKTVNSVCKAVFADVDPLTYNIKPDCIRTAITKRTRAIVVVHAYGNPCNMDEIREIAEHKQLTLIEDCAQCLLGSYKGRPLGSFGDYSIFSFRFSKDITCVHGGAVISNKELKGYSKKPIFSSAPFKIAGIKFAEASLRILPGSAHKFLLGLTVDESFSKKYESLTEYQLSLLEKQIIKLPEAIRRRRQNAKKLIKATEGCGYVIQKATDKGHSYYRFSLRYCAPRPLQSFMLKKGIQADRMYDFSVSRESESMKLASEIVNVPIHHNLKSTDLEHIIEALHEFDRHQ